MMDSWKKKLLGRKKRSVSEESFILSEESPFAVQEAYKTLRTNLMFALPDGGPRKIIVTSSVQGEGKSTTAVNLALAIAQNGSKVLLIECDMRLPTAAEKLGIENVPGLSNVILNIAEARNAIQSFGNGLDVLSAGDIPPNPTELLGSDGMKRLMELMGKVYDYIILDTPPICTVMDAAILSQFCSGVVLVVRESVADRRLVNESLRRLEFAHAKILGFAYTGVQRGRQKGYYKNGYGYGYESARTNRQ